MQSAPARAQSQPQAGSPAQNKPVPKPPSAPPRDSVQKAAATGQWGVPTPPPPPPPSAGGRKQQQGGNQWGRNQGQKWRPPSPPPNVPPTPPPAPGRAPPYNIWGQNSVKMKDRLNAIPREDGESKQQWKIRAVRSLRKWNKKPAK